MKINVTKMNSKPHILSFRIRRDYYLHSSHPFLCSSLISGGSCTGGGGSENLCVDFIKVDFSGGERRSRL